MEEPDSLPSGLSWAACSRLGVSTGPSSGVGELLMTPDVKSSHWAFPGQSFSLDFFCCFLCFCLFGGFVCLFVCSLSGGKCKKPAVGNAEDVSPGCLSPLGWSPWSCAWTLSFLAIPAATGPLSSVWTRPSCWLWVPGYLSCLGFVELLGCL